VAPVPSSYQAGLPKARQVDPILADRYVEYTQIGDPSADSLLLELQAYDTALAQQWIHRGIEGGSAAIPDAPAADRPFRRRGNDDLTLTTFQGLNQQKSAEP
jgi:hypothetical protein